MATMVENRMDPPYEDMQRYLNHQIVNNDIECDVSDLEAAIYFFAKRYHGGIESNLFHAMHNSSHRPSSSHKSPADVSTAAYLLYGHLVGAFAEGY